MRRFLIFALLHPLLASTILILVSLGHSGVVALSFILPMLAWSYVIGVLPAIILAFVDWLLAARLSAVLRIVSTALVGFVIAILFTLTTSDRSILTDRLIFGLVGAIPAAVCSWLSGEKQNEARR